VDYEQNLRQLVDDSLGLAVSVFTLCAEDSDELSDSIALCHQLTAERVDTRYLAQALCFVCSLLARYMTPEELRWVADAVSESVATQV
jgi:hypothetical protein